MIEQRSSYDTTAHQKLQAPYTTIVQDISRIYGEISSMYRSRDASPNRHLPDEEYIELRHLHRQKDQRIVDLLLERRQNPDIDLEVILYSYPGEKLHPFSMNRITINTVSLENPDSEYTIYAELSDLRKEGVVDDSLQASVILGETIEGDEHPYGFLSRTAQELLRIRNLTSRARERKTTERYSVRELEELTSTIIQERLVAMQERHKLPLGSTLDIAGYEAQGKPQKGALVNFTLGGRQYYFPSPLLEIA